MIPQKKAEELYSQGYRITGNHSAIKVCLWTKKAIRVEDKCYKNTFYGINSHRCVQMTPSLDVCSQRCVWCWRDIEFTKPMWKGKVDDPEKIIDGCIKEHVKYLEGFGGNKKADKKKYLESKHPLHFAISLTGEPTMYPMLPELIIGLEKRDITSFLVTNGTNPDMLKKLIKEKAYPTQIYITLPAPDEKTYEKACRPLIKDGWKRIQESLSLLPNFPRSTVRLTLVKDVNLKDPQGYAELIKKASPDFIECKAYMWVGFSQKRLKITNMPLHEEIIGFAERLSRHTGYPVRNSKENSRVVLLSKHTTTRLSGRKDLD